MDEQTGQTGRASRLKMTMQQELSSQVKSSSVVKGFKGKDKR